MRSAISAVNCLFLVRAKLARTLRSVSRIKEDSMATTFNVLFLLALFGPALAVITGFVVVALGVMTDRTKASSTAAAHEAPRAA